MSAPDSTTLSQLVNQYNPFEGHYVVKSQHVWGQEFPDVASLNAHASDAIINTVQQIKSQKTETSGIVVLAPRGVGKTHVLSRVRDHLRDSGDGTFIYMCEYGNLSHIKSQFLQGLVSSLRKPGNAEVMQCQEIVTALLNEAFKKEYSAKYLVNHFLDFLEKKPNLINQLTNKALRLQLEIDNPYIIRALIWTLSPAHALYALNWLAGRELSESQANLMGLPISSCDDRESEAFETALQILSIASRYTIPVICFDELDGTETADEDDPLIGGFTRAMVVASLGKDIQNNLKRGMIVTALYPRTWQEQVKTVGTRASDGTLDRIAQNIVELSYPDEHEVIDLVASWLQNFYTSHDIIPPHRIYPFDENELRQMGKSKPTVRGVLKWCAKNFNTQAPPSSEVIEKLYRETEESLEDFSDDNEKIAHALAFAFRYLKEQTLEGVTIHKVDKQITPSSYNNGYIQFKIIGEEDGNSVSIGVCVLQNSHGKGVGAGLKRLIQYERFDLTRGCLVRNKDIQKNWAAFGRKEKLVNELGGEWVSFKEEHIRPLIALQMVSRMHEEYEFTNDDFKHFLEENRLLKNNYLVCEILSDPSGQSPAEVEDEDSNLVQFPVAASDQSEDANQEVEEENPFESETAQAS